MNAVSRTYLLLIVIGLLPLAVYSQKEPFEGVVTYNVQVKSKAPELPDRYMKAMLATGEEMKSYIKNGKYRQSNGISDVYFLTDEKKVYFKFRKIDTLYYRSFDSDTSKVTSISRDNNTRNIAGYDCQSIEINSPGSSRKYQYAPALYLDPESVKDITLSNFDVYARETSAVWLSHISETKNYIMSQQATKVEKKPLDDELFQLPQLPQKEFQDDGLFREPQYTRNGGWLKYLMKNAKGDLGAKYIKVPKGESSATQQVMVFFVVSETGEVQNVKVLNHKEVHPKLAEEAMRVVIESGRWEPGVIYGEKSSFPYKQPITFMAVRE